MEQEHAHTRQLTHVYDQLNQLTARTLVTIIDELDLTIPENKYANMTRDVLRQARAGNTLTDRQKRVLVNLIGQPRP